LADTVDFKYCCDINALIDTGDLPQCDPHHIAVCVGVPGVRAEMHPQSCRAAAREEASRIFQPRCEALHTAPAAGACQHGSACRSGTGNLPLSAANAFRGNTHGCHRGIVHQAYQGHHDHFHVDFNFDFKFRESSNAQTYFVQACLRYLFGQDIGTTGIERDGVDGVFGSDTRPATKKVLTDLGITNRLTTTDGWKKFLLAVRDKAFAPVPVG
jgi:hypothetical protein